MDRKDYIWEVLKALIPEKYQNRLKESMQKALSRLEDFAKSNLVENKIIIEKLAKCCLGALVLCFFIGWISLAIWAFAIMICLHLLDESITFYSNINRSLKQLLRNVILWILGFTILCYFSISSNLKDVLVNNETSLQIQMDLLKMAVSFVVALFITFFYHVLNIGILLILFCILNITKKVIGIILGNRILRTWFIASIIYYVEKRIRVIFNM